jgi:hypothetical protein
MTFVLREDCEWQGSGKENRERERLHRASSPSRAASRLLSFYAINISATIQLHSLWSAEVGGIPSPLNRWEAFFSGQCDVRCEVSGVVFRPIYLIPQPAG